MGDQRAATMRKHAQTKSKVHRNNLHRTTTMTTTMHNKPIHHHNIIMTEPPLTITVNIRVKKQQPHTLHTDQHTQTHTQTNYTQTKNKQ